MSSRRTPAGERVVVSNMNGDWNNPVGVFVTLLRAEFDQAPSRE